VAKLLHFIATAKTQIYLMPENPSDFDAASEGKEMVVVGTLRYQPEQRSLDPSVAGVKAYFYLSGDCAFLEPGVL
jgi:hypothetical protein